MTDFKLIHKRVTDMKARYGASEPREIIEDLGIGLLEMTMGTGENAIKGFLQKNCRMITIGINSDLPRDIQDQVLLHETGHFCQRHLTRVRCGLLRDTSLLFRQGVSELDRMENEANFFAADYMLDTDETIGVIREYDMLTSARILRVPAAFLDYKLRLLHQIGRFEPYQDVFSFRSDFMRTIPQGCSVDP